VELGLWDLRGHRVKTLIQKDLLAGTATVQWDGTDDAGNPAASGAYLCRLRSPHGQATRRFVFMR
jgi:flagellar hook assembly protein FlgD